MEALEHWSEFNVAMVGATAALAGLVIVATSVNVAEIIKASTLTARLAAAIAGLVLAIVVCGVGLIPNLSTVGFSSAVLAATAVAALFPLHAAIVIARDPEPRDRARFVKAALGFLPVGAYLVAGLAMFGAPEIGLVAAAVGCLTSIISALVISWVALVEVLR